MPIRTLAEAVAGTNIARHTNVGMRYRTRVLLIRIRANLPFMPSFCYTTDLNGQIMDLREQIAAQRPLYPFPKGNPEARLSFVVTP